MLAQQKVATTTACPSITEDQQADCEKHLHQRLIEMNEKIQYHQNQFNEKKNNLIGFTSNIEESIQSFVQKHGVKPFEMKRNLKIAMINHDYDSEILRHIHKNMIDTVGYFLEDNLVINKLEQVTIQTIKNLLHIFLYNNVFYYKDKIYTLMKGSPNTMPLSDTLPNIFLFTWQKKILKEIKSKNEFFGRYKDQIFFTWNNGNEEQLGSFLQTIRDKKPNVQFQKLIGTNVPFLNAFVENQNGELFTRVYHHPILPRYTLPYVVGHSKLAHGDWFRSALIRAVCYCSLIEDFTLERIYLELTCLANGYSIFFVENNVQHFFSYFHADTMRYLKDQTMYDKFRHDWFGYMTMQYELSDKLQTFNDNDCLIHVNYLYEFGPKCQFNQQFHCLWTESFNQHANLSEDKVKIQLTTKHQHSLNSLLAREKSTCSIQ
ncbi:unnamed protein product [Rotaria magnacalcarata]